MVLQIARPTRLDTLVNIIKQNSQQNNNQDNSQSEKNWIVVVYDTACEFVIVKILLSMEIFTRRNSGKIYIFFFFLNFLIFSFSENRWTDKIFLQNEQSSWSAIIVFLLQYYFLYIVYIAFIVIIWWWPVSRFVA